MTNTLFSTSACLQPKSSHFYRFIKIYLKNWNDTLIRKTNLRISAACNHNPCPAALLKQLLLFISLGAECVIVDLILFQKSCLSVRAGTKSFICNSKMPQHSETNKKICSGQFSRLTPTLCSDNPIRYSTLSHHMIVTDSPIFVDR